MVGEQIVQFTVTPEKVKNLRGQVITQVDLSLVGEDLTVSDVCCGPDCGVTTNALLDQISTFATHTETAEVIDVEA